MSTVRRPVTIDVVIEYEDDSVPEDAIHEGLAHQLKPSNATGEISFMAYQGPDGTQHGQLGFEVHEVSIQLGKKTKVRKKKPKGRLDKG